MYTAVLMLALTSGAESADFGRRGHGGDGCSGYYGGSYGGCSGYYGGYSGGCSGYSGGGYSGCCGSGYRSGYYGGNYGSGSYYAGGSYNYPNGMYQPMGAMTYQPMSGTAYQPMNGEMRQSNYYASDQNGAVIQVRVPNAEAEIWFDGTATKQRGMDRYFHSPNLDGNSKYEYTIKAKWMDNGKAVNQERRVQVRAGQPVMVDFRQGSAGEHLNPPDTKPAPRPLPKEESR